MLSLCHIFSDKKFIDLALDFFKSDVFMNKAIYIGNENSYNGRHNDIVESIEFNNNGIEKITQNCCSQDVVIFYNLDDYNSLIANRLPKGTRMVWRFYGTEFYSLPRFMLNYYSDKTKAGLNINWYFHMKINLFKILRVIKYGLKMKRTPISEFYKAANKIEYFLAWDKEEYSLIKKHLNIFPEFIELTSLSKIEEISNLNNKNNNIVIGNSRAPENNHLDILDMFEESHTSNSFSLVFPLSYGDKGSYWSHLLNRIKASKIDIQVLDDFLPFDLYAEKIVGARAAVINTYRQMALGNTFLFLGNSVKVYISERSSAFNYLKGLGFCIFSIEANLKNDIINDELTLMSYQADKNRMVLDRLSDDQTAINFQNYFYNIFQKRPIPLHVNYESSVKRNITSVLTDKSH